jgi:hypothetical protein
MRYLWPEGRRRRLGAFHFPGEAVAWLAEQALEGLLGWVQGSLSLRQRPAAEEQAGEE